MEGISIHECESLAVGQYGTSTGYTGRDRNSELLVVPIFSGSYTIVMPSNCLMACLKISEG